MICLHSCCSSLFSHLYLYTKEFAKLDAEAATEQRERLELNQDAEACYFDGITQKLFFLVLFYFPPRNFLPTHFPTVNSIDMILAQPLPTSSIYHHQRNKCKTKIKACAWEGETQLSLFSRQTLGCVRDSPSRKCSWGKISNFLMLKEREKR